MTVSERSQCFYHYYHYHNYDIYQYVEVGHMFHGTHGEAKKQLGVGSVLPPYGFQGSNAGHQAWWQGPRASEPFARPMTHFN